MKEELHPKENLMYDMQTLRMVNSDIRAKFQAPRQNLMFFPVGALYAFRHMEAPFTTLQKTVQTQYRGF